MSDFKTTPETDLNVSQLLERYQLQDESTVRYWAKLHGINGNRPTFSPQEVDLIDHVHHHLQNLGMNVSEYQNLVNRRSHSVQTSPQPPQNSAEFNSSPSPTIPSNSPAVQPTSEPSDADMNQQTSDAVEVLMEQYSEAIDYMGEQIADHFITELDASVMRHLVQKVKARKQAAVETPQPNRLMKAIKVVFKSKDEKLLTGSTRDDSRLQMESNHRLG
jgi:DNA-binding transcriptional MerR regulator